MIKLMKLTVFPMILPCFFGANQKISALTAEKEKRDPIIAIRSLCHFVAGPRLELGTS